MRCRFVAPRIPVELIYCKRIYNVLKAKFHYAIQVCDLVANLVCDLVADLLARVVIGQIPPITDHVYDRSQT